VPLGDVKMKLSAIFLDNVIDINNYEEKSQIELFEGQIGSIYIQLKNSNGVRYVPQGSYSLSADFPSIDDLQYLTLTASQPFADDKSIFKIDFPSTSLPKSGAIIVRLTEGAVVKSILVDQAITVQLLNQGSN